MGKSLGDFVKDNQKFVSLKDGDVFSGVLLGSRIIPSKFDSSKETVEYGFKVDEKVMIWTNGNIGVAQVMMQLKKGDPVTIERSGEGTKSTYKITSPALKETAAGSNIHKRVTEEEAGTAQEDFSEEVPF